MTEIVTPSQLARLIDIGLAAAHLGESALARALFENLLVYAPGHAPARIGLAYSHLVVGDLEKARAILRDEVLAQNPDDTDAQALLGLTLGFMGETAAAAALLEKAPAQSAAGKLAAALLAQQS